VNGVKLVDILFSLLSVCLSVGMSMRTQSSRQQCGSSYRVKAIKLYKSCKTFSWRIYALSGRLLVHYVDSITTLCL